MNLRNDPEFLKLKSEFILSFSERIKLLEEASVELNANPEKAWVKIQQIVHKLAGIAGTYGFQTIYELSALIEDHLENPPLPKDLPKKTQLLISRLKSYRLPDPAP